MFVWTFLLRITHTVISQSIADSSWITLYSRAGQGTHDVIRRMRIACWITKATDTHSEYVVFVCLSTTKMVTRTRVGVTLWVALFISVQSELSALTMWSTMELWETSACCIDTVCCVLRSCMRAAGCGQVWWAFVSIYGIPIVFAMINRIYIIVQSVTKFIS